MNDFSYGPESTFCFLKPYMDFVEFREIEDEEEKVAFTYVHIPNFINSETSWKGTMRVNETACALNKPSCLSSFLFITGFTTLSGYREMIPLVQGWRAISKKYPELGVYAYTERSDYVDQSAEFGAVIGQMLFSAVICMGIAFIVFIPDVVSIAAAMFSLLSVNLGVIGFLSLWGVNIDPVSVAALLMSIGFSVDISAHISYHYYLAKAPTPREKLEHAFLSVGWPAMQGVLSTCFGTLTLLIKPSHLGSIFVKERH
ncbi:hypothetical protein GCK32_012848 [Trichostrongylus colubriformis]|uniref:SSD domain-containing protein n=1 Tax=Trichostrongylus colubriformis TaxID=6319 RepID=A0AAN8FZB8_TRICO